MVVSKSKKEEISILKREVDTFYQVNRFVNSVFNIQQLLDLIMKEAEAAVESEASCIGLYDAETRQLNIEFASGEKKNEVQYMSQPLGMGILGHVAAYNTCLLVNDAQHDSRFDPSVDQKTGFTTRNLLAVPISRRGELLGVLEVINKRNSPEFTAEDVRLLEVVANQAAVAIENARMVDKLMKAERMSAIGMMAASIVHDFNNPLTVIRGFTQLLENPRLTPEDRIAMSKTIIDDVDRVADMAQDLLDYSRGEITLNLLEINPDDWIQNITHYLKDFFGMSKMNVEFKLDYQGTVWFDPNRMRRVLLNLAANARDAMDAGGTFRVNTGLVGNYWELVLEDSGRGILPEERANIFKPFFTSGKIYGTGLGLAVSREIVEQHNGTIEVQTRVVDEDPPKPSGTTFFIRIPVSRHSGAQPGSPLTAGKTGNLT